MAVTPMKLVTVVGPLQDFDMVVRRHIINHEFHPEHAMSVMRQTVMLLPFDLDNPYVELLRQIEGLADRIGIPLDYCDFGTPNWSPEMLAAHIEALDAEHRTLLERRDDIRRRILENEQTVKQLDVLPGLDVPIQHLYNVTYVKFRFGRMPRETFESFLPHLDDRRDMFFFPTSRERNFVYGFYMMPRTAMETVDMLFASLQFERMRISDHVQGTTVEAEAALDRENAELSESLKEADAALSDFIERSRDDVLGTYSFLRYMNDSFNIRQYAAHTRESFYMLGWVPKPAYDDFVAQFGGGLTEDGSIGSTYVVVSDNADEVVDFTPPIKLTNPKIFKPFEPYVSMYGLPAYREMDPTGFMAITYSLIFGIMFGDMGHGLVLMLAGLFMYKVRKMWIGPILCYASVFSMIFGFLYGSCFGFENLFPWSFNVLHPSSNSSLALERSVYLGIFMITLVFVFNIINGIRQRNLEKIFFGNNAIFGIILFWSLVCIVMPFIGFVKPLATIFPTPLLIAMLLISLLVIFFREPLSKKMAKRADWKPASWGGYVVENIFELIEILLSYLTNTISFLRVGAYVISHASMMSVVFMLAGAVDQAGGNPVVLVIGNIVVMVIEGMLVAIQVLRLEFYELFGRFYAGDGKPYRPVKIDYTARKD